MKKFYPINLIKVTKIEKKIASVQNKKKNFIYNKDILLPNLHLFPSWDDSKRARGGRYSYFVNSQGAGSAQWVALV